MTDDNRKKAEEILRRRRLAAEGLADKPEGKPVNPDDEQERRLDEIAAGAVAASAVKRSG